VVSDVIFQYTIDSMATKSKCGAASFKVLRAVRFRLPSSLNVVLASRFYHGL
jgi:hypothetical protein